MKRKYANCLLFGDLFLLNHDWLIIVSSLRISLWWLASSFCNTFLSLAGSHLVLLVHYHAAFSRIQSVVNVFIALSQVVLCLKPTVQCIFNSLTIVLEFVLNCINPKYSDTKNCLTNCLDV